MMNTRRHRKLGFTLTELLITLAIIALISGAALPAIIKIGGFLSSRNGEAARELYGVLRAARVYAITFRTDTAVVYTITGHIDSYDQATSYVLDGYGIARRASDNEQRVLRNSGYPDNIVNAAYLPVRTYEARFQRMPRGTCVISHSDANIGVDLDLTSADNTINEPLPQLASDFRLEVPEKGMIPVYLFEYDEEFEDLMLKQLTYGVGNTDVNIQPINMVEGVPYSYPAHVFTAEGDMLASDDAPTARFVVNVGPAPDAPLDSRFTIVPDEPGGPVRVAPVRIELFRTTGRVKITS